MPAAQGYITVAANCSASLNLAGNVAANQACVTNVADDPVTCTPAGVNGRQICPISTADGPLFVRVAAP